MYKDHSKGHDAPYEKQPVNLLKTVRLGLSSRYPLYSLDDKTDENEISSIIKKVKCKFLCLKLPLNEINSPYANDYTRVPGLINVIPIIQYDKRWPEEMKYVVLIYNKT